jgi:hypothetical protein
MGLLVVIVDRIDIRIISTGKDVDSYESASLLCTIIDVERMEEEAYFGCPMQLPAYVNMKRICEYKSHVIVFLRNDTRESPLKK